MAGPEPMDRPPELHETAINAEGRGLITVNDMKGVFFLSCNHSIGSL